MGIWGYYHGFGKSFIVSTLRGDYRLEDRRAQQTSNPTLLLLSGVRKWIPMTIPATALHTYFAYLYLS